MNGVRNLILLVLAVGLQNNKLAYGSFNYSVTLTNMTYYYVNPYHIQTNNEIIYYGSTVEDRVLTLNGFIRLPGEDTLLDDYYDIPFCSPSDDDDDLLHAVTIVVDEILTEGKKCPIEKDTLIKLPREWSGYLPSDDTYCGFYDLEIQVIGNYLKEMVMLARIEIYIDNTDCKPVSALDPDPVPNLIPSCS